MNLRSFVLALCLAASGVGVPAWGQEFRAFWADTFHAGMNNASQVTALVDAVRAANFNAVVVEVRKRGDAYYRNGLEPVATGVASGFDPLADLVQKAHDTTGGKARVEVHAWMVTYNIWNNQNTAPPQATHPYNLHADWLSQRYRASEAEPVVTWAGNASGGNYMFDPGHPDVQQHTFDVFMDVLTRYDVDGLHFDYVRYPDTTYWGGNSSQPWGYHPLAVERFNRQKARTGTPAPSDTAWLQWRRDQVTALVRKVCLSARALKPQARVSAATIAYDPAPASTTLSSWQATSAYRSVLQDWRAWMQEGILDLACPMAYKVQASNSSSFATWVNWTRQQQFTRASAIGMGWYLNPTADTLAQFSVARAASGGFHAAGVVGYSYAVFNNSGDTGSTARTAFNAALTTGTGAPFPTRVLPPAQPWKDDPALGHLMGTVREATTQTELDGATLTLTGPVTRTLFTDATGFFGAIDLPVGTYTLTFAAPGWQPWTQTFDVTSQTVVEKAVTVSEVPLEILSFTRAPASGQVTLTWASFPGRRYRVESSATLASWDTVAPSVTTSGASASHSWTPPAGTRLFVRVVEVP